MNRRNFLLAGIAAGIGAAAYRFWPDQGIWNPCAALPLPQNLADHDLVKAAWDGLDASKVWDVHVHLAGGGDSASGVWLNPRTESLAHPLQSLQRAFLLNAACLDTRTARTDAGYVERLAALQAGLDPQARLMLLAFDYSYDESGKRLLDKSEIYVSNDYANRVAKQQPRQFEWIASIHPYRRDAVAALEEAAKLGARAVKWLPSAMGINPASNLCDDFYVALKRLNIPLLSHAGSEYTVSGSEIASFNNPLLLRRPLQHGVRVIVAHCASLGASVDIDKGANAPMVDNFQLFARLMDEPRHEGKLFGDISAMTLITRVGKPLKTVVQRSEWHNRLLYGSDYPLTAVMPLFSMRQMVAGGYIGEAEAPVLSEIRKYNSLLFDLALKRHLKSGGKRFLPTVFETRPFFTGQHA